MVGISGTRGLASRHGSAARSAEPLGPSLHGIGDVRTSGERVEAAQTAQRTAMVDWEEQEWLALLAEEPDDILAMSKVHIL